MEIQKVINIAGFDVEIIKFSTKTYMYPMFNENFEVEATVKGYKQMSHYLRGINWITRESNSLIQSNVS